MLGLGTIVGLAAGVGTFFNVNKLFKAVGGNSDVIEMFGGIVLGTAAAITSVKTVEKLFDAVADAIDKAEQDRFNDTVEDDEAVKDEPEYVDHFTDSVGNLYFVDKKGIIHKLDKEVANERTH